MLSMKNSIKWSEILSRFQSVLNNSRFAFTFKSSNEVLYEFKSKQSLNFVANILEFDISKTKIEIADAIIWSKLNQKRNYDKNHMSMFLKKESYVYLRMHHEYFISLSNNMIAKWSQRRIKSFKVFKKIENLTYRFEILADWKIHFVLSIQQLESISHDIDSYNRKSYDNSLAIDVEKDFDDEFYEIEKLINKRIIRKRRDHFTQYLIRWKRYDSEHDTWYTINDLKNAADFVIDYERNLNSIWINKRVLMCISDEHWYSMICEFDYSKYAESIDWTFAWDLWETQSIWLRSTMQHISYKKK